MTYIHNRTSDELSKWRKEARSAAALLKSGGVPRLLGQDKTKVGFAFDDDVIVLELEWSRIDALPAGILASFIFNAVLSRAKAKEH